MLISAERNIVILSPVFDSILHLVFILHVLCCNQAAAFGAFDPFSSKPSITAGFKSPFSSHSNAFNFVSFRLFVVDRFLCCSFVDLASTANLRSIYIYDNFTIIDYTRSGHNIAYNV